MGNELTKVTSCTCPGYEAIFECIVVGQGTTSVTIWQGTALEECASGKIKFRHSQIRSGSVVNATCGTSIGRAISLINDSYTSQLVINVSQNSNNKTIECADESGTIFGRSQVSLTTGNYS